MSKQQNRYIIRETLSEKWACHYLAHDTLTERDVVLKLFPGEPEVREQVLRMLQREAALMAQLSHPAFPKLYEWSADEQRPYLTREYVQGKELESLMQKRDSLAPIETVITWGLQLCNALIYLHNFKPYPIIYRDLKPQNLLMKPTGELKIIDMGTAIELLPSWKPTVDDRVGTAGYAPPEQYWGYASPQVDIYALGATLHRLLTNIDPCSEPFTFHQYPIREHNPAVSPELAQFIETAVAYRPFDRFSSVVEMRQALKEAAKQQRDNIAT